MQTRVIFQQNFYLFAPSFDEVLQQNQSFVNMSPVFAMIVESLPNHLHDFCEGHHIVSEVGDLRHHRRGWTPWVV